MIANIISGNRNWFSLDTKGVEVFDDITSFHQRKFMIK